MVNYVDLFYCHCLSKIRANNNNSLLTTVNYHYYLSWESMLPRRKTGRHSGLNWHHGQNNNGINIGTTNTGNKNNSATMETMWPIRSDQNRIIVNITNVYTGQTWSPLLQTIGGGGDEHIMSKYLTKVSLDINDLLILHMIHSDR